MMYKLQRYRIHYIPTEILIHQRPLSCAIIQFNLLYIPLNMSFEFMILENNTRNLLIRARS